MPTILFTRTPGVAEAGPGHDFAEGREYDVSPKSAQRWIDLDFAIPAPERGIAVREVMLTNVETGETVTGEVDFTPPAVTADAVELVEAGGEAPPIVVPISREARHVGGGHWHVYEGERRITDKAVTRAEAQSIADGILEPRADLE